MFTWIAPTFPPNSGLSLSRWRAIWGSVRLNYARWSGCCGSINKDYWSSGMPTTDIRPGERVKDAHLTEDTLSVDLMDGRTITVPLVWYPRLLHATPQQRMNWRVCGGGYGIHWPDVDEDLSSEGLLRGAPAPRGRLAVPPTATGVPA